MSELYGEYDGDADEQYVACVVCGDLVDLLDAHPMFREESIAETGDVTARTYHFCGDSCLRTWQRTRDAGE